MPPQLVQGGRNAFLPEIPPCSQIHEMRLKTELIPAAALCTQEEHRQSGKQRGMEPELALVGRTSSGTGNG